MTRNYTRNDFLGASPTCGRPAIWRGVFYSDGVKLHTNPHHDRSIVERDLQELRGLGWIQIEGLEEVKDV